MLIFVRHGATDFNDQGKWMGSMDIPLNDQGIKQARHLAIELKRYNLSKIYSSPLGRAFYTAIEIQKQHQSIPIAVIDELRERSLGVFEGMEKTKINYQRMLNSSSVESLQALRLRLAKAFSKINREETVVVVSHSAVFRCLVSELGYRPAPKLDRLDNGQYIELLEPFDTLNI